MNALIQEFEYIPSQRPSLNFCTDVLPMGLESVAIRPADADLEVGLRRSDALEKEDLGDTTDDAPIVFEKGRAQGYSEGRAAAQSEVTAAMKEMDLQRIAQAVRLNEEFEHLNNSYLRCMEGEVLKLALLIASRVLQREVEADPLALRSTAQVALRQLADRTSVQMRVPAGQADIWRDTIVQLPDLRVKATVVADESLKPGDCRLETDIGSADLGVRSQLLEIARAFMDDSATLSDCEMANR